MPHVLAWDIETVPDLAGFAAANAHDGKTEDEIRAGREFSKHICPPDSSDSGRWIGPTGVLSRHFECWACTTRGKSPEGIDRPFNNRYV